MIKFVLTSLVFIGFVLLWDSIFNYEKAVLMSLGLIIGTLIYKENDTNR